MRKEIIVFDARTVIDREAIVAVRQYDEMIVADGPPGFAVAPQLKTFVAVHLASGSHFNVDCKFAEAVEFWTGLQPGAKGTVHS